MEREIAAATKEMELLRVRMKESEEIVEGLKGVVKERDGQLAACEKEFVVLLIEKMSWRSVLSLCPSWIISKNLVTTMMRSIDACRDIF